MRIGQQSNPERVSLFPDGLVVTNYHVIQGAAHLAARTNEGARLNSSASSHNRRESISRFLRTAFHF